MSGKGAEVPGMHLAVRIAMAVAAVLLPLPAAAAPDGIQNAGGRHNGTAADRAINGGK